MPNSSTDPDDQLTFLYDKLRIEILHNDTLSMQLLGVSMLLVTGIMGFGLNNSTPDYLRIGAFLSAIIILSLGMLQTIERMRGTFIIASYMRKFMEGGTEHIKWETRLDAFRSLLSNHGHKHLNTLPTKGVFRNYEASR